MTQTIATVAHNEEVVAETLRLETVYDRAGAQREAAQRRRTFRHLLVAAEAQIKTDLSNDSTTTPFSGSEAFNNLLRAEGGFNGTLTEAGFDLIRERAIRELGDAVDLEGYPCEAVLASGKWGSLLMMIVRLYALTFGQAKAIMTLNAYSNLCIKDENRTKAGELIMQLVAPEETQKGMPQSLVQRVISQDMNVKLLTGYIKMGLWNLISNYMNAVKRGTTANFLEQAVLLEDHPEGDSRMKYGIAEQPGPAQELDDTTSAGHMTEMLCRGFRDLSPEHKEVMRAYHTNEELATYSKRISLGGQIAKTLDCSGGKGKRLADEIVASMRKTLGVTVTTRTISMLVADPDRMRRIANGEPAGGKYSQWHSATVEDQTFESPFIEQEIYLIDLIHKFYKRQVPTQHFMDALN